MAEQGRELPGYVQRGFEDYLQCGRLEYGFLRMRCNTCHAEYLVAFSCKRIACIEDPVVMPKALATLAGQALQKILNHLKEKREYRDAFRLPESLGPPQTRCVGKENPFGKDKDVAGAPWR